MRSSVLSGAAILAAAQLCSAQTFTSCNPTSQSNCPSDAALGKSVTIDFTKGESDYFTSATGTTLTYDGTNGANFAMAQEGQAPTITSKDYIFFGKVTVVMQAAAGQGIVSSFVMESDDLDEIDWEWLGGDTTQVESNYFGKGNTSTYDRAIYHTVSTPQTTFHTYVIDWTKERIIWSIDGTEVRTLLYTDAVGGKNFPQTPMVIKMGNWDGGASTESAGTIEWAGGLTDWTKAPFNMYVKSVTIEDSNTGATSYSYGDETGSYDSIKISNSGGSASASGSSASSSATSTGSAASGSASSTAGSPSASSASASTASGSKPSASSNVTPPFQDPAPAPNATASSNLTTTAGSPGTSSTLKASKTASSASTSTTSTALSATGAASKHGAIDVAVLSLGLAMGYFFM